MAEESPNRAELVEARERLISQIAILRLPARARDINPQLVARLEAMVDEINSVLTDDLGEDLDPAGEP